MLLVTLMDGISFFWDFTPQERVIFAEDDSFFSNYKAGEFIIHEGDDDDSLQIVIKGSVNITRTSAPDRVLVTL
ncbi:MAG: cyclic nucleotide-binding domain-containing protein, partial [Magnetococcales bacterium]|nr:cyclic nucleotide-binding domain-containing protein [Magnetococcales bacterium]